MIKKQTLTFKVLQCSFERNHVRTRGNSIGGVKARGASWIKVDGWIKENGFWHGRSLDATWTPLYDKVRR